MLAIYTWMPTIRIGRSAHEVTAGEQKRKEQRTWSWHTGYIWWRRNECYQKNFAVNNEIHSESSPRPFLPKESLFLGRFGGKKQKANYIFLSEARSLIGLKQLNLYSWLARTGYWIWAYSASLPDSESSGLPLILGWNLNCLAGSDALQPLRPWDPHIARTLLSQGIICQSRTGAYCLLCGCWSTRVPLIVRSFDVKLVTGTFADRLQPKKTWLAW